MPEYICTVAKNHRRSYALPQEPAPQCCGRPMTPAPDEAPARPASGAGPEARATPTPGADAPPRKEKEWWQHWR
jgi:hypothetical protein